MDNKRIQEVFAAMNDIYATKDGMTLGRMTAKLSPMMDGIFSVVKELVAGDENLYYCMFMMNFKLHKRIEIISKHLGVNAMGIQAAGGKQQDIFTFCASTMTYEIIANMYDSLGPLYGLTLKETVMAWIMMMKKGMLLDLIILRKHDEADLIPEAVEHIKKMDQKFDIAKILDNVIYGDEEDELEEGES